MADHRFAPLVIDSKLTRPGVANDLIARPRLLERLDRHRPLTVAVAPAGYGKTTLLSSWLMDSRRPVAWLSLDPLDNDPANLLTYLVAAVQTCDPQSCRSTLLLSARTDSDPPPWPIIARSFARDLAAIERPILLVLDNYQVITEPNCHVFIVDLVRHQPPTLQLVIASRRALPLPMAKLRAAGVVTELGAGDLKCSLDEATAFLLRATNGELDPPTVRLLAEQTEGWLAGLRLAALHLRRHHDPAGAAASLTGQFHDWRALNYLTVEVLDRQPTVVQELLVRTAILDRLCAALCAALLGEAASESEGQDFLDHIERENLFIFPLDEADGTTGRWYRFHQLFRHLLQERLRQSQSVQDVADLHRRAAAWLAEHNHVEEALTHYLAAEDEPAVVALIEAHRHRAMNREQFVQLERWLRLLPTSLVDRHPELVLLEAWTLLNRFRWEDLPGRLERAVTLLEGEKPTEGGRGGYLMGEVEALRGQLHLRRTELGLAMAAARRALAATPVEHAVVRGVAWVCLGSSLYLMGDAQACFDTLYEGLKEDRDTDTANPTQILMALCYWYWMTADLARLTLIAERLLVVGQSRDLPAALGWGHYFRGCARYVCDDLSGAASDFEAVADRRVMSSAASYPQSVFGLAMTHMARGDFERPLELADSMVSYALESTNTDLLAEAEIFQGLVALVAGRPLDAARWIAPYSQGVPLRPMHLFHIANLSVARILVTLPLPEHRAAAAELLDRLLAFVEATRNTRFRIDVLALRALLHAGQGDTDAALAALAEALRLAETGGLVRVFVDLRPGLDPLLSTLAQRDVAPAFIAAICSDTGWVGPQPAGAVGPQLAELLTFREADVLLLLCQRMTNREIAHALSISPDTVKEHTVHIYRKLGVHNRREAIARALALGIVRPRA